MVLISVAIHLWTFYKMIWDVIPVLQNIEHNMALHSSESEHL